MVLLPAPENNTTSVVKEGQYLSMCATPMSTISVDYFSICTLLEYVYCLWPLPRLLLVCTTLVCLLFVATTTYTISVNYGVL